MQMGEVLWTCSEIEEAFRLMIGWRNWFYFHGFCTELWLSFENEIEGCVCVLRTHICKYALFLWSLKGFIECCIVILIYIHSIQLKRSHNFFFLVAFLWLDTQVKSLEMLFCIVCKMLICRNVQGNPQSALKTFWCFSDLGKWPVENTASL